jgi:sugar phosphate isomerase/epimerase
MKIQGHTIGVCSWSLRPANASDLLEQVRSLGLGHIQLALGGLLKLDPDARQAEIRTLRDGGVEFTAAMISFPGEDYLSIPAIKLTGGYVPDEHWEERRQLTLEAGKLAAELGISTLSTHIGFVPRSNDPHYGVIVERICSLAGALFEQGIELLMETGQESSSELLQFLNTLSCKNVGINFDPANMILYGSGDPIDAILTLGRHVRHVHVKDAVASMKPGLEWGNEVPFGDGQVPHSRFLQALQSIDYRGPLVIEREAGEERLADVAYAIETLEALVAPPGGSAAETGVKTSG